MATKPFLKKGKTPFKPDFYVSFAVYSGGRGVSSAHAVEVFAQRFRYVSSQVYVGLFVELKGAS